MATVTKFQDFADQLVRGIHDFDAHSFKVALTNSAPLATNTVLTDITQIAAGNGYTAGGNATTLTMSETSGTMTVQGTAVTFTASGGAMASFRYYVLYNDTAASKNLVAFWDHGSTVSLANSGDSFVAKFNNTDPGTIFTLA